MLDFVEYRTKPAKKGQLEVYPDFIVKRSNDLMVRGKTFYAIWDEQFDTWSTDEFRLVEMVDKGLYEFGKQYEDEYEVIYKSMRSNGTKIWDNFVKYCKVMPDNYHELDTKVIFKSDPTTREDYSSKRLPYDLDDGSMESYNELVTTLYSPEERLKFEWAIGSVFAGKSKEVQKFFVFYGSGGTGKSTVLHIIEQLFLGYWTIFDAKSIVSSKDFALEQFKSNPLIGIQHDGDLSRIDDNSRLNSLVSHEDVTVNEKFKSQYKARFNALLFIGTNRPVQITEAKSGLIRRLVDISPSGKLVKRNRYDSLMHQIRYELGSIAKHCMEVFEQCGPLYFENYRAEPMIGATNEFYNYIEENWDFFSREKIVTLSEAWRRYKLYCEDANVSYPLRKMIFKNELKNYFDEFKEHTNYASNVYLGFIKNKFKSLIFDPETEPTWLWLEEEESLLDDMYKDCLAQYATKSGVPKQKWANVKTTLKDIDVFKEHFVKPPIDHIVIDFDFKDDDGNKDPIKNIQEAEKWPKTYAEYSKSGGGIHLHYIYKGDVETLANRINEHVEIKKFTGNSALRRRLSKCNDIPIATINSGLPQKKGGQHMINFDGFTSEKALRNHILKCMRKEHHGATKPEVDFIFKALEDAYKSGMSYDLTTMRPQVLSFAMSSSNQSEYCMKLVTKMHFASDDKMMPIEQKEDDKPIIFYDVEVFPNLFLVNWKLRGKEHKVVRMINPTSADIENLVMKHRLIGFNCRRYDNHIMYGRMLGYSNLELYDLSQKIINNSQNAYFGQAYNLSYTDVYDYASAGNKMSLKKWEIKLGLHHQELGLPWDKPVAEELWNKVAEYCDNDVISTEAVFDATQGDFTARKILSELSGLTINDTTNSHSKRIIFQGNRSPQNEFVYTDLSEMFPGYKFDMGVSTYRGVEVGEGGYVWSKPGMYEDVLTLDVASMHPTSIEQLNLFGDRYTKRFSDIKKSRIMIKHNDLDGLDDILDGKLVPFVESIKNGTATYTTGDLANALKTVINSVYGLSTAHFDNEFRDPRNVDNIVAKRGALFMVELKHECDERQINAIHIKTDSIKLVKPSKEQIDFVIDFGAKYGYIFEVEHEYDRICLINDADYIALEKGKWKSTGKTFSEPYVFKTMFSKEPMEYRDYWQAKESKKGELYLDLNEDLGEDEHDYHFIGKNGAFVPISPGNGGGWLMVKRDEKYVAAPGTKGYRWLDVEMATSLEKEGCIDMSYYDEVLEKVLDKMRPFGDPESFVKGDKIPYFQE